MTGDEVLLSPKLNWLRSEDIRPYVFVRSENRIPWPGQLHKDLSWFQAAQPIYKNPLEMEQVAFANRILDMEAKAFGPSGMVMPRWVFYDCAILPGFVAGYAARTSSLPPLVKKILAADDSIEWTPLSLFIIIPTMKAGEWVAHNLCSVNSLLPKENHYYGIGFISKAFGLWYANVQTCCGVTQWKNPAIRLHAHYGDFEILTAWTPTHSYPRTLTYRLNVEADCWHQFFTKEWPVNFHKRHKPAGFVVDPDDDGSLKHLQMRLERGHGPFFLSGQETMEKDLSDPLTVYTLS
jgi:hypothetical protein